MRCITIISIIFVVSCQSESQKQENHSNSNILKQSDCNWCGTAETPENTNWETTIASENEPGDRIQISGIVYKADSHTPAEDVIIYVYHTNSKGIYPKKGTERGSGKYHGYFRSWMKTNKKGQYKFETIRPAPYQSHGGEPAHIHYTIQAPGKEEYWINSLWFKDDPRITDELIGNLKRTGGFSNVVDLKMEDGILKGKRNIILTE